MTEIDKFNRRLGEALGLNPHGEPLYKWFHTDTWMHHMKKIDGSKPVMAPSGIIVMEPVYVERLMCPELRGCWIVGHWHDAGSQYQWLLENGTNQLWPNKGYYVKTNAWMDPGQEPTFSKNEHIIALIRKMQGMTSQEDADQVQAAMDREEAENKQLRDDMLNDILPTYAQVPGIRGGHVSYPSVTLK